MRILYVIDGKMISPGRRTRNAADADPSQIVASFQAQLSHTSQTCAGGALASGTVDLRTGHVNGGTQGVRGEGHTLQMCKAFVRNTAAEVQMQDPKMKLVAQARKRRVADLQRRSCGSAAVY